ncbi:MAG TPA: MBL fold metallo-hydrolase [Candidatus Dormibacteraeota bacterium]|nr:MBL fold metallo-hydrolase [Candidatus Dormibacteraeota bacterium]
MTAPVPYVRGLHDLGSGHYTYLQPDGSWGLSNAGLVTDAGQSLLVDTLFDLRLTAEMLEAMRRATPAAATIGVLVNSHSNGDHTFGNRLVGGARIVASRRCAEEMVDAGPERLAAMMRGARAGAVGPAASYLQRIFGRFDFAGIDRYVLPTETFDGSLDLRVGGKLVRLLEVGPAHTAGDVIVHAPADGVVYTADLLFIGVHPVVWAGPVSNWVRALDLVLSLDAEVIVPGHGPIPTRQQVVELRAYWEHLLRECRLRLEAGQPPREAALDLGSGPYAGWGEAERLIINVQTIYRELSGEPAQPRTPMERFETMAEFDQALRAARVES